jgi:CYTH domain-containing protein
MTGWTEHQRRFLVSDRSVLPNHDEPRIINQAYLFAAEGWAVRVRRVFAGQPAGPPVAVGSTLAVKGPRVGGARAEEEWPLHEEWAARLFSLATAKIFKRRYPVVAAGTTAVIDEFFFDNEGLLIAEFESREPLDGFLAPPWCGREVTSDRRYDNEAQAHQAWSKWRPEERA